MMYSEHKPSKMLPLFALGLTIGALLPLVLS
jgi:hypothetical protein